MANGIRWGHALYPLPTHCSVTSGPVPLVPPVPHLVVCEVQVDGVWGEGQGQLGQAQVTTQH